MEVSSREDVGHEVLHPGVLPWVPSWGDLSRGGRAEVTIVGVTLVPRRREEVIMTRFTL